MHAPWLFALALLVSGCTGSPGNSDAPADEPGDEGGRTRTSDGGATSAVEDGSVGLAKNRLVLTDCFHLLGFVPMDWATAQDLIPTGFRPLTWTVDEDPLQSLAVLEVLFVSCQGSSLDDIDLGPSASLWLQPDVDADQVPLLAQNNFHAYSAHSNPAVQIFWAEYGVSELGTFATVADVPDATAVVTAEAPSLSGSITMRESGAIAGLVTGTWRVFYENADGVHYLDMHEKGARGTFPGSLDIELSASPFPLLAGLPAGASTGFGNGHGEVAEVIFDGPEP